MKQTWKRALLPALALLALGASAQAQAPHRSASHGSQARLTLTDQGLRADLSFGWGKRRGEARCDSRSGYWRTVRERVWVPGCSRQEWVPDRYGWVHDPCGRKRWALVQQGHYITVQDPGYYEWQTRKVWVSARTYGGHGRSRGRHDSRRAITRGR